MYFNKFSIIICCYNEEANIKNLIISLSKINYDIENFEIIIVDDGSIDKTLNLTNRYVQKYLDLHHINVFSINHSGLSIARNTGYFISKHNYCLYCDADAMIDSNILYEYNLAILNKSDYIYTGKVINLNKSKTISNIIFNTHNEPSLFFAENKLIGANMLLNKKLISEKFPFFDSFKARGDETAMFLSIQKNYNINNALYVNGAIVKNETSENFTEWFKKMYVEGSNNRILINYFEESKLKKLIYSLFKINTPLVFIIFLFSIILNNYFTLIVSFFIFLIRMNSRKKYLLRGLKNNFRIKYYYTFFSFFISIFGVIISDIGYAKTFFLNNKMTNLRSKALKIKKIEIS